MEEGKAMTEAIKKKLKKKALEQISLLDALKEVLPQLAEIRIQVVKYKGHEWFAIMVRGKEDKE